MISRVAATRVNSTPPARVGTTTASAPPMAARTILSSPGGVSTTAKPSCFVMARTTVRPAGPSTTAPSILQPTTAQARDLPPTLPAPASRSTSTGKLHTDLAPSLDTVADRKQFDVL